MSTSKISAAIGCLSDKKKMSTSSKRIIEGKTVLSILKEKQSRAKTANTNYIIEVSEDTTPYHHSLIEQINAKTIRELTLKTHGSHGPSGLDAFEWRRILTHFNQTSIELCKRLAKLSYTIASKVHPHENLTAYNSCHLINLDKNSGVRPIGIGEVQRRKIGKTITRCIESDFKNLEKDFQLCLGLNCDIEYTIQSLRNEFEKPETDAILLTDAENASNSLIRELVLQRPNSTKRPTSTAPITTQKETSPKTPETNVLPNATQIIDLELEIKINDICKNVVNWIPRFLVLSKNMPGFQFVE